MYWIEILFLSLMHLCIQIYYYSIYYQSHTIFAHNSSSDWYISCVWNHWIYLGGFGSWILVKDIGCKELDLIVFRYTLIEGILNRSEIDIFSAFISIWLLFSLSVFKVSVVDQEIVIFSALISILFSVFKASVVLILWEELKGEIEGVLHKKVK